MEIPTSTDFALFVQQQILERKALLANMNILCAHDFITLDKFIQVPEELENFSNLFFSQL